MTLFKKDRYKVLGPKNEIMQIILIEKQNPICFPPKYFNITLRCTLLGKTVDCNQQKDL